MKGTLVLACVALVTTTLAILLFLVPNTFGYFGCHTKVHTLPRGSKNRETLRRLLYEVDDAMKEHGIAYWLGEGTCLGAVREQQIIMGDTDVDLGIDVQYKPLFYNKVLPYLVQRGFRLGRGSISDSHSITTIYKDDEYVDIDFTGDGHRCYALEMGGGSCQKIMNVLRPFQTASIGSRSFPVPSVKYLELLYGDDWRIPKRNFKPWHT